jgi:hypothetical protein
MWPFSSSTEPPVVERRVNISAAKRLLNVNHFKKAIKKAIPSVTKEEMEHLVDEYGREGNYILRVTRKAEKILDKYPELFSTCGSDLQDIEDTCRCGYHMCHGCIQDAKESLAYSATNNGIIREHNGKEFNDDGALINQIDPRSGGIRHAVVW